MITFVKNLFTSDFMPHGHCYLWRADIVWLNVISDVLIALAYYSIPITLAYFVRKRRDLPYPWMFLLFGGFIVACGTTHVMEVWNVWHGTYRLAGIIKAITAVLSIGTAILLVRLMPEALTLRGPQELARLNLQLQDEVGERRRAEEALREAHEKLELRVQERSAELAKSNAALGVEIIEHQRAIATLDKSQAHLAGIIGSAMDAIITIDSRQQITVFNTAAEEMFRCRAAAALGQPLDRFIPERFREAHAKHVPAFGQAQVTRRRMGALGTVYGLRANGEEFPLEASISQLEAGGEKFYTVILRDITERTRAEEKLKKSLREKEVLLKEVHHRVKNNLQVVSSLLSLQSSYIKNPEILAMLKEDQTRVQSMALVHEKLYRSPSLSQIEFGEYLENLTASLVRTFGINPSTVGLKTDVDKVFLGVDSAIPCGLIVNELVSNSLKYAFPDGRAGEIRIALHADENRTVTLTVGDNGVGLPPGLDVHHTESLGLQLVHTLVTQLHGTMEMQTGRDGTEFRLRFVEPDHKQLPNPND